MAKKKMRRDVLIYRIVFALMCIALVAIIAIITVTILDKTSEKKAANQAQTNTVSQAKPSQKDTQQPTEPTQQATEPTEQQTETQQTTEPAPTPDPEPTPAPEPTPTPEPEPTPAPEPSTSDWKAGATVICKANSGLNIRKEANSTAEVIAPFPKGDKAEIVEVDGDWVKIKYDGKTGYAFKKYLELE